MGARCLYCGEPAGEGDCAWCQDRENPEGEELAIAEAERRDFLANAKPHAPGAYTAEGEWQGDTSPPYIPIYGQETDEWRRSKSWSHEMRQIARVMVPDSAGERDEHSGEVLETSETMATVRLFVAAPELLAGCVEALDTLMALEAGHHVGDTLETIATLRSAVATARGVE